MKDFNNQPVICFGETLWDVFEKELKPGGAPMNVAVHLRKFGIDSKVISRVGKDELGNELLDFLVSKNVDTSLIQTDDTKPTGLVNVEIGEKGDASYDIVFPSAWDFIAPPDFLNKSNGDDFILVFGSLASRNIPSQETLLKLLEKSDLALFDVNFRAPHYTQDLIERLLSKSDIVKLNEHEIVIIGNWLGVQSESYEELTKRISMEYAVDQIIVTLGDKGALVFFDGKLHRHHGFKIDVVDTVGSGDSFLASYLANFIKGLSVDTCLELACATGAYVATQNGAVPDYGFSDIQNIMNSSKR